MSKTDLIPRFAKVDKRLLGTWKSDRARTFKEWKWTKKLSPEKQKRFQSFFGKLEITYTRTRVISSLRYRKWEQSRRYVLVAADESSVAIVQFGKRFIKDRKRYEPENLALAEKFFPTGPTIQHIHFDGNHYWASIGVGRNREFFRKVTV